VGYARQVLVRDFDVLKPREALIEGCKYAGLSFVDVGGSEGNFPCLRRLHFIKWF